MKKRKCKHDTITCGDVVFRSDSAWPSKILYKQCVKCKEYLSLGAAADTLEALQEMLAMSVASDMDELERVVEYLIEQDSDVAAAFGRGLLKYPRPPALNGRERAFWEIGALAAFLASIGGES